MGSSCSSDCVSNTIASIPEEILNNSDTGSDLSFEDQYFSSKNSRKSRRYRANSVRQIVQLSNIYSETKKT